MPPLKNVRRRRAWYKRYRGPRLERLAWLGRHQRVTERYAKTCEKLLQASSVQAVAVLLKVASLARSRFYREIGTLDVDGRNAELKMQVRMVFKRNKGRYAIRRVTATIQQAGHLVSHMGAQRQSNAAIATEVHGAPDEMRLLAR
ncbi:integrase catalytic region [Burkholderia lata]|uniref:hypothetical protein n=1 Tax=Burkholderia lata (strain ATCC 17760 / DSM 23089 / LMG 22485 / NCIMB 9086 / R18194 / 383) TaxID=482957 RepID=UPI001452B27C|nr:integrase catalytic region [Burkholderia lata]